MSSLDLCCIECQGWAAEEYEPRIAELEAEVKAAQALTEDFHKQMQKARKDRRQAEADLAAMTKERDDYIAAHFDGEALEQRMRAEQAEAENKRLRDKLDKPPHPLDPFLRAERAEKSSGLWKSTAFEVKAQLAEAEAENERLKQENALIRDLAEEYAPHLVIPRRPEEEK